MPVGGEITFEGQPLERGTIQFYPEPTNSVAIAGGAMIDEGVYAIPRSEGLVPGNYQVRISSASEEATVPEEQAMPGLLPDYPPDLIPEKYNFKTELRAEVTEEGPNTFDFTLTK